MENGSYYYEKARKRWRIQYTDNDGNRKSIYGKTIEEVQAKHDQIKVALRNGTYIEKKKDTIQSVMEELLDDQERNHELKEGSMLRKRETAKIISEMSIASRPIQNVTAVEIRKDLAKLVDPKGKYNYSQSYVNKVYSLLRSVYDKAVEDDIINFSNNILRNGKVKKPKSSKDDKDVKPFNKNELESFLKQLEKEDNEYKDIFYVLMLTGMRVGECLALYVENIHIEEKLILIETSITKNKEDKTIRGKDTKTKNSIRSIPLTERLIDILEPRIRGKGDKELVFSHNNQIISSSTINKALKRVCAHANIRVEYYPKNSNKPNAKREVLSTISTHSLRHLAASLALSSGAQAKRRPASVTDIKNWQRQQIFMQMELMDLKRVLLK